MAYTHPQVIEAFITQGSRLKAGTNLIYDPETKLIYSFGRHFPLAAIHQGQPEPVVLLAGSTPSSTTSKHRSQVMSAAIKAGLPVFCVPAHLLRNFYTCHERGYRSPIVPEPASRGTYHAVNLGHFVSSANKLVGQVGVMRGDCVERARSVLSAARAQLGRAREYAAHFSLQDLLPEDLPPPEATPRQLLAWHTGSCPPNPRAQRVFNLVGDSLDLLPA